MSLNFEILGKQIKRKRRERGISQAYLAEKAEIEPSYVSIIENGKKRIGLDNLIAVACALDTTLDELLTGNQGSDTIGLDREVEKILSDCTLFERRILIDVLCAVKQSIRMNMDFE